MSYSPLYSAGRRTVRVTAMLSALLLLLIGALLLAGCGGGNSTPLTSVYASKSVTATKMTLGSLNADLQVSTAAVGSAATGTLTLTDPTRDVKAAATRSRVIIATPNCTGTYDPKTGALNLTGSYEYPAGTKHTFTVTGTLPVAPSYKGAITITIDGTAYGPFLFGDNTPSSGTSTGNTGTTGTTGGGTVTQGGLTISGASGTTDLKNGPFSKPFAAQKYLGANGQYNAGTTDNKVPSFGMDLFDVNLKAGETFDQSLGLSGGAKSILNAYDSNGAYIADSGTITVTAVSDASLTLQFTKVHFKAAEGTTPPANQFILDGSVTCPLTIITL